MGTSDIRLDPEGLLAAAEAVRARAYAPYSGFKVGAALLDSTGRIHRGVNVENASYGLTTCAERTALVSAVASGAQSYLAIAIAGPEEAEPCMPCGSCRQILHEMAPELLVIVGSPAGAPRTIPLAELLPDAFDLRPHPRGRLDG